MWLQDAYFYSREDIRTFTNQLGVDWGEVAHWYSVCYVWLRVNLLLAHTHIHPTVYYVLGRLTHRLPNGVECFNHTHNSAMFLFVFLFMVCTITTWLFMQDKQFSLLLTGCHSRVEENTMMKNDERNCGQWTSGVVNVCMHMQTSAKKKDF